MKRTKDDLSAGEIPSLAPEEGLSGVDPKQRKKRPVLGLRKADEELQIVWGEVYVPDIPDSQGDFMTREEIRKMAYTFLASGRVNKIDVNHDNQLYGCYTVESFIARDDDPLFIPGSWVMGVHIPDQEVWALVKKGELNGFSLQADVEYAFREIEMAIPDKVTGATDDSGGHSHKFSVTFGPEAQFLGGVTDMVDGHFHIIKKGTLTEPGGEDGHTHRFAFLDEMVDAQS